MLTAPRLCHCHREESSFSTMHTTNLVFENRRIPARFNISILFGIALSISITGLQSGEMKIKERDIASVEVYYISAHVSGTIANTEEKVFKYPTYSLKFPYRDSGDPNEMSEAFLLAVKKNAPALKSRWEPAWGFRIINNKGAIVMIAVADAVCENAKLDGEFVRIDSSFRDWVRKHLDICFNLSGLHPEPLGIRKRQRPKS